MRPRNGNSGSGQSMESTTMETKIEETETPPQPVPYDCDECDMVVAFYPGFIMTHAGRDRHAFTISRKG